jgi:hypothetical protein
VGFRRWTILILIVAAVLGGILVGANSMSGPYDISCQTSHPHGFSLIFTSVSTNQQISVPFPVGGCPAS